MTRVECRSFAGGVQCPPHIEQYWRGFIAAQALGERLGCDQRMGCVLHSPEGRPLTTVATMSIVYAGVLANLGLRIVDGAVPTDTTLTLEGLQAEFGVSRTTAREVVQVLASKGLVESRRRTGVRVRPPADWDHFDPAIIRWRLEGDGRAAHLYDLSQLRAAVEPLASALAAVNADAVVRSEIVGLAHAMETAGAAGDLMTFLDLDIAFHRMLLAASKNVMFDSLGDVVEEVLRGRTDHDLMPPRPKPEARHLHLRVAQAVAAGDADGSRSSMQAICVEVVGEMHQRRRAPGGAN